jgi:hypothetical protein
MPRAPTPIPVGTRFAFLVVVHELPSEPRPSGGGTMRRFVVRCDCGRTLPVRFWNLKSGNTKSCAQPGCEYAHRTHKHWFHPKAKSA